MFMLRWSRFITIVAVLFLFVQGRASSNEATDYSRVVSLYGNLSVKELAERGYAEQEDKSLSMAFYQLAISKYSEALPETEKYFSAIAMNNLAYIYLSVYQNPEQAYPWLVKAVEISERNRFETILPGMYDNIAKIYDDYGDAATAITMYRRAFRLTLLPDEKEEEMRYVMMLMTFNDLVPTALHREMLDSITGELEELERQQIPDIPMSKYSKMLCRGIMQMQQKEFGTAVATLSTASDLIDSKVDRSRYIISHNLMLAVAFRKAGDLNSSMECLRQAENTALESSLADLLPKVYRNMAEVYSLGGQTQTADKYRFKAMQVRDSLYDIGGFGRIKNLETSSAIDSLNREIHEADIRQQKRLNIIYLLIAGIGIAAVMLILIVNRNRRLAASNRALVEKTKDALRNQEMESRLRHDYEKQIAAYKQQLEASKESDCGNKTRSIPLGENEILQVVAAIKNIMENSDAIFSPNFSLEQLAEMTGTNPKYLSGIINDMFHKNLNQLLAEARIHEACRRLTDKATFGGFTIDSIAESVGYKSRTHFSSVFKKITGVTPAKYTSITSEKD